MKTKSSKPAKNSVGGVRTAGVVLLICFMLIYVVVIGQVLISSLGGLMT